MKGELISNAGDHPDAAPGREPPPALTTLVRGLDDLRDALHRRLEHIEALAVAAEHARAIRPGEGSAGREQALRERVATLEASQARMVAEVRRREQEWEEQQARLEHDRRLLADAWDRLEREQIAVRSESRGARPAAPVPPAAYRDPAANPAPVPRPAEPPDVVSREILSQFQALKNDVRRNAAEGKRG
jgi:hypothetical protein